jgi:ferredoxin
MSRFGLRKRLKARLGRSKDAPATTADRFAIVFELPDGSRETIETEAHYTLHMASQMLETPIEAGCPDGHCGGCLVDVLDDSGMQAMNEKELTVFREKNGRDPAPGERLACHARVLAAGVEVKVRQVWNLEDIRGEEA